MLSRIVSYKTVAAAVCGAVFAQGIAEDLTQCPTVANWDAKQSGPLLVLEPDKVKSKKGTTLADFKRKIVQIGSLQAVVPDTMVVIDESGLAKPDLYDGLSMCVKVLYLLTLLDKSQFNKVCQGGIGLADLRDEQIRVFDSIVPKPFKYEKVTLSGASRGITKATLTDSDRTRVKLRLNRLVSYQVKCNEGGYSQFQINRGMNAISDPTYRRDFLSEFDRPDTLGVTLKKSVPNNTKPSDIDYTLPALQKQIDLLPSEKTIDLLKRIEQETGRELYADIRVANRVVVAKGAKAKIGDVLQALALSVTGTYRKVGRVCILTSDLAGSGERAVRIALWQSSLNQRIWSQQEKWRNTLTQSNCMQNTVFDASDPLGPNDAVKAHLEANRDNHGPEKYHFDFNKLPVSAQDFLRKQNEMSRDRYTLDEVGFEESIGYGFVLPDGNNLIMEHEDFGPADLFETRMYPHSDPMPEKRLIFDLATVSGQKPLVLRLVDSSQASAAIKIARAYGFNEIWVESRSKAVIAETVRQGKTAGISVRLVVRPFALVSETTADEDLSILGENGERINSRILNSTAANFSKLMLPQRQVSRTIGPDTAKSQTWINRFVDLAKIPGLSGVVVMDTIPRGYVDRNSYTMGIQPAAQAMFGYPLVTRLQSIRRSGIDPIDIAPTDCHTGADLRQPFFLDDGLRGGNSIYDGRDIPLPQIENFNKAYEKALAASNEVATQAVLDCLADASGNMPVWVEARLKKVSPEGGIALLFPWKKGMKVAQVTLEKDNELTGFLALALPAPTKRDFFTLKWWGGVCGYLGERKESGMVAHDATEIKLNLLDAYLRQLFVPRQ